MARRMDTAEEAGPLNAAVSQGSGPLRLADEDAAFIAGEVAALG
jgi:hypothetical protein